MTNGPVLVVTEDDKISLGGGMHLCPGCEDRFVLSGYCDGCKAIHWALEDRRRARLSAANRPYRQRPDR